jgi:hypothetical protein
MQRLAGNAAVTQLVEGAPTAQRCGPEGACLECEREQGGDSAPPPMLNLVAQRRVDGDVRTSSITPEWTRALTDEEVAAQVALVRDQLAGLPATDPLRPAAETNLRLLQVEAERRTAAETLASLKLGPLAPRPSGLPGDQGYALVDLPDLPASALDHVPEGLVTTVETAVLYGAAAPGTAASPSGGAVPRAAEAAGIGGGAGTVASGINMARWGFPGGSEGGYSVGIVVRPRANPIDWGHTALTLRRGGAPLDVVGFNPDMRTMEGLVDIAKRYREVEAGTAAVRGRFTSDSSMFTSGDAVHIEYPISEAEAAQFAMTKPGLSPNLDYVARPAVYRPAPGACSGSNCGLWAIGEIESQTGGVVGRVGDPAGITSMGPGGSVAPGRGSQPAIVEMARGGLQEPGTIRPLVPGGAAPVVSSMPRLVRVLRVGGKVMLVVGIVAGAYEIVAAKPEEQARTAAGVAGGFAGGFLLGATAGLICGPGAPLCSFVLGVGLGTLGALGGRAAAEAIYDEASSPSASSAAPGGGPAAANASSTPDRWELLFIPPPPAASAVFPAVAAQAPFVRLATPMDLAFAGPLQPVGQ